MTQDQLFNLSGLAVTAIAAKATGQKAVVNADHLIEATSCAKKMREAIATSVETCEVCRSLGELVTDRCPRCRPFVVLLEGGAS
jgi:hypothetical protein